MGLLMENNINDHSWIEYPARAFLAYEMQAPTWQNNGILGLWDASCNIMKQGHSWLARCKLQHDETYCNIGTGKQQHGYLFAPPTKKLKSITWFPSGITGNPPKKFYHMVPTGYHRKKWKKWKNREDAPLLGCYPGAELYPILSHFVHKNLIGRWYKGPSKYLTN